MQPQTEAEWEEAVIEAGKAAFLTWVACCGAMKRACQMALAAEAAGVKGAAKLLPEGIPLTDPDDPRTDSFLRGYVDRGFVSEEVAARMFRGQFVVMPEGGN